MEKSERIKTVNSLHNEAMEFADQAFFLKRQKDYDVEEFKELNRQGFEKEKGAAMMLESNGELEPTRGILFYGAACFAKDAGLIAEAKEMVAKGLEGDGLYSETKKDLEDILQTL